jgi:hypothetical protein
LNPRLLIRADEVDALFGQPTRLLIEVADGTDLLAEGVGVLGVGIEPVAAAVRLQLGLFLKINDQTAG